MFIVLCLGLVLLTSILAIFMRKRTQFLVALTQIALIILLALAIIYTFKQKQIAYYQWDFLQFDKINLYLSLQWDNLAKIMVVFILTIGFFIYRYAQNYLESDQTRTRFLSQLNLVLCSVLLLVMAGNLLTAFVAWQLIGINIYLLLNHYHDDPAANRAAKKKFVINRVGDSCFLLAIVLVYHTSNTSSFYGIQASPYAELICGLIFISVMTKCAQFPFHVWLVDTMETPTPVSALMHAGVINAGGVLLARVSHTLVTFHLLNYLILFVGLTSAILSIQWMNNQPDTKKKLAYSTMGQMGYMLSQCSLGAFPAAIFHLMSHGFYKASLFLNSGETIVTKNEHNAHPSNYKQLFKPFLITLFLFFVVFFIVKNQNLNVPLLICGFVIFTLMTIVYKIEMTVKNRWLIKIGCYAVITLLLFTYFYCFDFFSWFLSKYDYTNTIPVSIQIAVLFILVVFQIILWTKKSRPYYLPLQDWTESFLRRWLLNPLRFLGNIINLYSYRKLTINFYLIFIGVTCICIVYRLISIHKLSGAEVNIDQSLIFCFLAIAIISLVIANRCNSIRLLVAYLVLFQLAFLNITWFDGDSAIIKIGFFHFINIMPVMLMLYLLARNKSYKHIINSKNTNRFPVRVFYLTFSLLLLIGIPGTASFISEFYLLNALIGDGVLLVLMYISLIILIAIVIMHSLQLYVFNKSYAALLSNPISKRDHIIFLGVIGLNILSGIFPYVLLRYF